MSALKRTFLFFRDRLEGGVFLFLFPLWLIAAFPGIFTGVLWRRKSVGRWLRRIAFGLADFREAAWVSWKLEPKWDTWVQLLQIEFFAALNVWRTRKSQKELPYNGRIAVLLFTHLGDGLHVLPTLDGIRRSRPDLQIDLIAAPWASFIKQKLNGISDVCSFSPRYVALNRGQRERHWNSFSEMRFFFQLRSRHYDAVLVTANTGVSDMLLVEAIGPTFWLGAASDLAKLYGEIPGQTHPYDSKQYEAERIADLMSPVGVDIRDRALRFPIPNDAVLWAKGQIGKWRGDSGAPLITIAPGAGWPGKVWFPERFAAVAHTLHREYGACVALLGAPAEQELTAAIADGAGGNAIDLGGKTSIDQMAALIAEASLFIGNDSGPLHIAAALGTPTISLFGPTVAAKWAPRGKQHRVIQKDFPCTDCWSWHPRATCQHNHVCMQLISVDDVLEVARELFNWSV